MKRTTVFAMEVIRATEIEGPIGRIVRELDTGSTVTFIAKQHKQYITMNQFKHLQ